MTMIGFIDDYRNAYGPDLICRVLPITQSTYHEDIAQRQDPTHLSARARQDAIFKTEVARVFAKNFAVYGVRKVWRQLIREMGLAGVIRGSPVRTTISDKAAPCPIDHANRHFYAPAPNMLAEHAVGVGLHVRRDLGGVLYLTFVIGRIVGWRASGTAHTSFILDALEQALHQSPAGSSERRDPS